MASSTVIPSAGKNLIFESPLVRSDHISRSNSLASFPNSGIKNSSRISASIAVPDVPSYCSPWFQEPVMTRNKEGAFFDNLDGWMRESVVEIVKSLKKAPLLVHVYCNETMELKTEKGFAENWDNLEKEWRKGERKSPDGIILVEQLEDDDIDLEIQEETKAWGVLIQGKGMERECRTSCYLLKTCRVNSGLGFSGTHFSLVKVKNFRDSAFSQLKNSWLL